MLMFIVIAACLFSFGDPLFADTVVLRNGKIIDAKIVFRDESKVQIDFQGMMMTYWMDEVASINALAVGVAAEPFVSSQEMAEPVDSVNKGKQGVGVEQFSAPELNSVEIQSINEIIEFGWKEGVVGDLIEKYRGVLEAFKKEYSQVSLLNDLGVNSSGIGVGTGRFDKKAYGDLSFLLMAEAEQARVGGRKEIVEADIAVICNFLSRLSDKPIRDNNGRFLVLFRHQFLQTVLNNLYYLLQHIVLEEELLDRDALQRVAISLRRLNFVFFEFDQRTSEIQKLKNELRLIEDEFYNGKSLSKIMGAKDSIAGAIPLDKVVVDGEFWRRVYEEFDVMIEDAFPVANKDGNKHPFPVFIRKIDNEIAKAEADIKGAVSGDIRDKVIRAVGDVYLIAEFRKIRKKAGVAYFILNQLEVANLGISARLFELDNGRSLTSLADLVPEYIDTLNSAGFANGKPFIYNKTDQGGSICSVGLDGEDDQARKLLTLTGLKQGYLNGDVCFFINNSIIAAQIQKKQIINIKT